MNKIKKSIEMHAFNEDELLSRITMQADREGLTSQRPQGGRNMKKVFGLFALSFALVLALWIGISEFSPVDKNLVTTIVAIDINPSFEVSVSALDNVVKVEAVNEEAETIEVDDLIGMKVEDAVDLIIQRAGDAGFINIDDLDEDFVVVTSISLKDKEEDHERIQDRIQDQIKDSEYLQSLNIVSIKATQREKFEAEGKDIPVGLYVINGYVLQEDGTYMKAGEFFSNPENKEAVKNRVEITEEKELKLRERIEKALGKLESKGIDATEYRQRLENADMEEMLQIQAEIKVESKQAEDTGNEDSDDLENGETVENTETRGNSDTSPKANDNAGGKGN